MNLLLRVGRILSNGGKLNREELSPEAVRLVHQQQYSLNKKTDKIFCVLMLLQYFAGVFLALHIAPYTWYGSHYSVHIHVFVAIVMGLGITIPALATSHYMSGTPMSRHTIAVCQALWSSLLIHLSGGRIETHFHVFGSLALLAFYRDWKVLITASALTAADHFIRGRWFTESVFGVATTSPYRWMEHAGWVVFEDVFLIISVIAARNELVMLCRRQIMLQQLNREVEKKVFKRTRELRASNESLKNEMAQRKEIEKERERLNQQLIHASREAGKAEIATGVLHNVGNVLNSVSVSCNTLEEKLSLLKLDGFGKTANAMREQGDNIGEFMSQSKGRCIPEYLDRLTLKTVAERDEMREEMRSLRQHINHIAKIVAMQQSNAKAGIVKEELHIQDLIDDAIQINQAAIDRHNVEVEVNIESELPRCWIDKHRVLQIVVNLVRNAKQAVESRLPGERFVSIHVALVEGFLEIAVRDNGMGISKDNLTRVFSHGFTTKVDGHGFG
ncbi:MAG: ATP-binding protein, partial [Planctomycetota bacterium]